MPMSTNNKNGCVCVHNNIETLKYKWYLYQSLTFDSTKYDKGFIVLIWWANKSIIRDSQCVCKMKTLNIPI